MRFWRGAAALRPHTRASPPPESPTQTSARMLSSTSRCSSLAQGTSQRRSLPQLRAPLPAQRGSLQVCDAASLQFVKGIDEPTVPEVRLTRSRTGSNGTAMFVFDNPSIFQANSAVGEITGLFMVDDEGTLTTTDVKAKFVNGKPQIIEAKFNMRSQFEWDRFMRFMDRYSESAGLGFEKGQ